MLVNYVQVHNFKIGRGTVIIKDLTFNQVNMVCYDHEIFNPY